MLETSRLTVHLGAQPILHGIDCRIEAGQCYALVGPNGSGKTTLLRALCGFLPFGGKVLLDGQPLHTWSSRDRAQRLSYVPQSDTLHYDFTVDELVRLGQHAAPGWRTKPSHAVDDRVEHALRQLNLTTLRNRSLQHLSGGERQRAFLAMAVAQATPLMLLDEPTAHLDLHHQHQTLQWLQAWLSPERTALVSLHDLSLALRYADQLLVLDKGHLVAQGPPLDVLTHALLREVFNLDAEVIRDARSPYLFVHAPTLTTAP